MGRKVKLMGGVGERSLGMELRYRRTKAGISMEKVGEALGWSANTISRLERGQRQETTPEEVSALLAVIGVTGDDRERLLKMAKGDTTHGWWEPNAAHLTDQARTYLRFEFKATRIIDVEPLLVPGLLQTPDYCRALMNAFGVEEHQVEGRIARRLGRQGLLTRAVAPDVIFIVTELMLRQPFGGHEVMVRQVRHMAEVGERPNVSIRVLPASVVEHPGLLGGFVVLEFADEAPVVFIEGRMSGMFPGNQEEVNDYGRTAERLTSLALGEQESLELLHSIAEDHERARYRV
ncbi:MAG TPA: helix-turn-helix transcriptional regulator [Actinophytocola sp.]|uniref:helix-turn-helix domain-containing protein n=1 Tax=Actinophytocola sp. TaxID=1872138 RepID=UPI002DDD8957|nr:helix-turn-helix transcriptional regulator [Actinophytocola sp.]HEV2783373.1 helix-turn-helix transcriptional regulator [Actinophytocola sp.]